MVAGRATVVSSLAANLFSLSRCEETGANMRRERATWPDHLQTNSESGFDGAEKLC